MVGRSDLPNAVSLNSTTFNLARIVGPALAGVLIAVGRHRPGRSSSTRVFTIAVIVGLRVDARRRAVPLGADRPHARGSCARACAYVKGRPDLVLAMVLVFVVGTFGFNYQVTIALMAKEVFGLGAAGFGLFTTAFAVGSLGGALLSTRRTAVAADAAAAVGLLRVRVHRGRWSSLMPTYWSTVAVLLADGRGRADVHVVGQHAPCSWAATRRCAAG